MRIQNLTVFLLPAAILLGLGVGLLFPGAREPFSESIDPLVLVLLGLLFFEVRFEPIRHGFRHLRFLSLAWSANFIIIPLLGWAIASLFFKEQTALYTGLLLYFLFPCTDWFLGFTRMAKGDVALGTVLLPVNLVSQLILFPVFVTLFFGSKSGVGPGELWGTMFQWFLLPLLAAWSLRLLIQRSMPAARFESLLRFAGAAVSWVLAALVFCIFVQHSPTLTENLGAFLRILLAVFVFFALTWLLGEVLSRKFRLGHAQHALLAMTTAARNAPLILGLTTVVFPDQPLIHAALIIGMLVEFPHLTALSHLLVRQENRSSLSPNVSASTP